MTPQPARIAAWMNATPRWGQALLALALGAVGGLAHAPFDIPPMILIPLTAGFVILAASTSVRSAFWRGWALGAGYFGLTMTWILEPFQVDAAVTGWMAPIALVLLAALLGLFWGVALGVARCSGSGTWALVITWSAVELLRAYLFTGLPWATPPQALVDGLAGQALAWLGPHGLMLVMAAVAALIVRPGLPWVRAALVVLSIAFILIRPFADPAPLTDHVVRLVQPNAPQREKWDPDRAPIFVNRQIDYTQAGEVPDLVIWPETALPYLQQDAQVVFEVAAEAARAAPVVLGIQRHERGDYFNGLVVLGSDGQVTQTYDKHHLVPFGEYMPFKALFRRINVGGLAQRVDRAYVAGPGPRLLDFGALGTALPLICYEAVFAHNMRGTDNRPAFLMQLTNDAWFGTRSGPQQHLAQARMRSIEQGLPMLRAANTGISAVIDPKGRVIQSLPLNTTGYLDAHLPTPASPTFYSRTGDLPWTILLILGALAIVLRRFLTRTTRGIDAGPRQA